MTRKTTWLPDQPLPQYADKQTAAAIITHFYFPISPRTLERWRWTGEGPAFLKIGGRVIYRLEDVEAYENGRRCESTVQSVQLRAAQ